jgi:hypothetical protein
MMKNSLITFLLFALIILSIACSGSGGSANNSASTDGRSLQFKAIYGDDSSRLKLIAGDEISVYEFGSPSVISFNSSLTDESVSILLDTQKDYVVKLSRNGTYFMKTLILNSSINADSVDLGTINAYTTLLTTRAEAIANTVPSGEGAINQAISELFGNASLSLYDISLANGKANSGSMNATDTNTLNKMILYIASLQYINNPSVDFLTQIENNTDSSSAVTDLFKSLSENDRTTIQDAIEADFVGDVTATASFISSLAIAVNTETTTPVTDNTTTETNTDTNTTNTDETTDNTDTTTDTTTDSTDTATDNTDTTTDTTTTTDPQISGTIRDINGNAIAGALVQVIDVRGSSFYIQSTSSSSTGLYEFSDIPAGTYYILVDRDDYKNNGTKITIN